MKKSLIVIGIIVLVILVFFLSVRGTYNRLVALDENVKTAWSQVENQFQRRLDLIPNYVETVKGYAKQEKEVLLEVTNARAKVAGASSIGGKIGANNQLSSALARLLVVVERYPVQGRKIASPLSVAGTTRPCGCTIRKLGVFPPTSWRVCSDFAGRNSSRLRKPQRNHRR
jgi:hypothetical protein